jgi:hypothetical protein
VKRGTVPFSFFRLSSDGFFRLRRVCRNFGTCAGRHHETETGSGRTRRPRCGGAQLAGYGLQSPVGLIRMMIQQSNGFIVVERGVGMQNLMQERALTDSGQARAGSNMGGGQIVSADFILTPAVVIFEKTGAESAAPRPRVSPGCRPRRRGGRHNGRRAQAQGSAAEHARRGRAQRRSGAATSTCRARRPPGG